MSKSIGPVLSAALAAVTLAAVVAPAAIADTTTTTTTTTTSEKPTTAPKPPGYLESQIGLADYNNPTVDTPTAKKGADFLGLKPYFVAIVCDDRNGKPTNVSSDALDLDAVKLIPDTLGTIPHWAFYVADASVRDNATLGRHSVTAQCGEDKVSYSFDVLDGPTKTTSVTPTSSKGGTDVTKAKDDATKKREAKSAVKSPQVKVKPKGRIETGGGATAQG